MWKVYKQDYEDRQRRAALVYKDNKDIIDNWLNGLENQLTSGVIRIEINDWNKFLGNKEDCMIIKRDIEVPDLLIYNYLDKFTTDDHALKYISTYVSIEKIICNKNSILNGYVIKYFNGILLLKRANTRCDCILL